MKNFPMADTGTNEEKYKILNIIEFKQLCGMANNTKWNELINTIRQWQEWQPSYRYKTVANYISDWDVEWYYHLPFPFIGVEWFDIGLYEKVHVGRLVKDKIIDHTKEIIDLLILYKFEYEVHVDIVRIWGYSPKTYEKLSV